MNQIAAGEVVERPYSVVKELVDNSIDAEANEITIKIDDGGLKLIEITDNGKGIEKEMLPMAFEAHATSKITSLEDLAEITSMGFRGEALSTIVAVSTLSASSKHIDSQYAFKIAFDGITPLPIEEIAHPQGTTVSVQNIFANIPVRKKFLKSPDTEYRYILQTLIPFFIYFPNIHFKLLKNGKQVYNLPKVEDIAGIINQTRLSDLFKKEFPSELIPIHSEGSGLTISGLIAHPKFHLQRTSHIYTFVNGRSIKDKGIARALINGYSTMIPKGHKVPAIISLNIKPSMVDVNVHPRKEEIRFQNPYRIYIAIEEAIKSSLKSVVKSELSFNESLMNDTNATQESQFIIKDSLNPKYRDNYKFTPSGKVHQLDFTRRNQNSVEKSIQFSKNLLQQDLPVENDYAAAPFETETSIKPHYKSATQIFDKYYIVEFENEIWMVDQHAAAERVTYERLLSRFENNETESQKLLIPHEINLESVDLTFISENLEFFNKLGINIIKNDDGGLQVEALPVELAATDIDALIADVLEIESSERDLEINFEHARNKIIASIACHNSIRARQKLFKEEIISQVDQLIECQNPYSCPHGRPVIWKLAIEDIDKNFDRTY